MTNTVSLHLQAAAGDARAQVQLARMLLAGDGAPRNPAEALRLIDAACAQENADALLLHAALAAMGYARPHNLDHAFQYLTRGAAKGDVSAQGQLAVLGNNAALAREVWLRAPEMEQHAAAPRVFTVSGFLPKAACEWLMKVARRRLQPSTIIDAATGKLVPDPVRSSSSAPFSSFEPDLVAQLACLRIAGVLGVPLGHQEPINVLHYRRGQQYRQHYDFIRPGAEAEAFAAQLQSIGQRVATVLIYLNDEYEGGETEFPRLGKSFKGKAGDALIFWNLSEAGVPEVDSLHAGAPVTKGEKWLLSKWVRQKPYPLI